MQGKGYFLTITLPLAWWIMGSEMVIIFIEIRTSQSGSGEKI